MDSLRRFIPFRLLEFMRGLPFVRSRDARARHRRAVAELESCFRSTLLSSLPARDRRVDLLVDLIGTGPSEALYILDFMYASLHLPGDVCEFGVAQGATSALIANELLTTKKQLWLFDSFRGLPAPSSEDVLLDDIFNLGGIARYEGTMVYAESSVRRRLRAVGFPPERTRIVPGLIERIANSGPLPESICFAYIDSDFYKPVSTALQITDRRLSRGGCIVVDDYAFFSIGAKRAVDEFVESTEGRYQLLTPPEFAGHFVVLRNKPLRSLLVQS